jgi:hypothetical protein
VRSTKIRAISGLGAHKGKGYTRNGYQALTEDHNWPQTHAFHRREQAASTRVMAGFMIILTTTRCGYNDSRLVACSNGRNRIDGIDPQIFNGLLILRKPFDNHGESNHCLACCSCFKT